jgi:hypothetical protein
MPLTMKPEFIRRKVCNQIDGATVAHADAAIARAADLLSNLVHYRTGATYQDEDIARLAVEFAREMVREERLVAAAVPFITFIERFERNPLSSIADDFYSIHSGEDGASLRLSELRQLRDAVRR